MVECMQCIPWCRPIMRSLFSFSRGTSPEIMSMILPRLFSRPVHNLSSSVKSAFTRGQEIFRVGEELPARTRFAPSPTGYLHIGSLRTALFNYVIAKASGGQFLLRIEDTDQKRTIPDSEEKICQDLKWAGLDWDEGPDIGGPYGPYRQSERIALHQEHAKKLIDSGSAYRCFCSMERIVELSRYNQSIRVQTSYDRKCADISPEESDDRASKGEAYAVRLKLPDTYPLFTDMIYGEVPFKPQKKMAYRTFLDPILLKRDGSPTYHLANVVDDHFMRITHVVRGSEWMPSTPYHLIMYQALGWQPPKFAHVGLLVGLDNQKLSKRDGRSTMIEGLRVEGIFPEALINFAALQGASYPPKLEVMSLEEIIQHCGTGMKFTRGDVKITFNKLKYLQREHGTRLFKSLSPSTLNSRTEFVRQSLSSHPETQSIQEQFQTILRGRDETTYIKDAISISRAFTHTPSFITALLPLFTLPNESDLSATFPDLKYRIKKDNRLTQIGALTIPHLLTALSYIPFCTTAAFARATEAPLSDSWAAPIEPRPSGLLKSHSIPNIQIAVHAVLNPLISELIRAENGGVTQGANRIMKDVHKAFDVYLRWALGVMSEEAPGPRQVMCLLGPAETIRRLGVADGIMRGMLAAERMSEGLDEPAVLSPVKL